MNEQHSLNLPNLGIGVGLRTKHYRHILETWPTVDWFEIISENFMETEGRPLEILDSIAERYPIVMHGVSMSIGSSDPLDVGYLKRLRALRDRVGAVWVSDHLCWTGVNGRNTHDLLPMPYTEESLRHVAARVRQVQDFLDAPLLLENPSTYAELAGSTLGEAEFFTELTKETGCGVLLDVNNIYVSCFNHDLDPRAVLSAFPLDRVAQIHVAGHTHHGTHIVDTHIAPVSDPVWWLYAEAHRITGGVSTLLEWDAEIPDFETTHREAKKARLFVEGAARAAEVRP